MKHCEDMYPPQPTDPIELTQTRELVKDFTRELIRLKDNQIGLFLKKNLNQFKNLIVVVKNMTIYYIASVTDIKNLKNCC